MRVFTIFDTLYLEDKNTLVNIICTYINRLISVHSMWAQFSEEIHINKVTILFYFIII